MKTFLSNLQLLKYNVQNIEQKKKERNLLACDQGKLAFGRGRQGHGFHTGPAVTGGKTSP